MLLFHEIYRCFFRRDYGILVGKDVNMPPSGKPPYYPGDDNDCSAENEPSVRDYPQLLGDVLEECVDHPDLKLRQEQSGDESARTFIRTLYY
jgi:hypothetical protein